RRQNLTGLREQASAWWPRDGGSEPRTRSLPGGVPHQADPGIGIVAPDDAAADRHLHRRDVDQHVVVDLAQVLGLDPAAGLAGFPDGAHDQPPAVQVGHGGWYADADPGLPAAVGQGGFVPLEGDAGAIVALPQDPGDDELVEVGDLQAELGRELRRAATDHGAADTREIPDDRVEAAQCAAIDH